MNRSTKLEGEFFLFSFFPASPRSNRDSLQSFEISASFDSATDSASSVTFICLTSRWCMLRSWCIVLILKGVRIGMLVGCAEFEFT